MDLRQSQESSKSGRHGVELFNPSAFIWSEKENKIIQVFMNTNQTLQLWVFEPQAILSFNHPNSGLSQLNVELSQPHPRFVTDLFEDLNSKVPNPRGWNRRVWPGSELGAAVSSHCCAQTLHFTPFILCQGSSSRHTRGSTLESSCQRSTALAFREPTRDGSGAANVEGTTGSFCQPPRPGPR